MFDVFFASASVGYTLVPVSLFMSQLGAPASLRGAAASGAALSFRAWSFLAAASAHIVPESPRVCCMHTWAEPASHLRAPSAPWSLTPLCGRLVRPQSCSQVIVAAPELDVMICNKMLLYFYLLVV